MPYGSLDLFVAIHPKGYYMYIMVRNKHVIYRADYDFDEKTFTTPYLVCGKYDDKGITDGVGGNVRMNEPQQGCFVKNEEYTGQKDEYDFYFVDKQNHCVRTLTPTGRVRYMLEDLMVTVQKDLTMEICVKKLDLIIPQV